ncbi:hypothetical protein CBS147333_9726 [Penicillium roqueforti]|nr:hypothetical protein CBS147354_9782 [Penicillium roqueforti]KAI3095793.1 hypothetical protein CBS147333_9726 [Penicillium roqueforti]KAI3261270.1 hypothetical protein CBS147308_9883 [Penicillium roqueforti]KAI3278658.1 hypothetical protein DTO003C3_9886 [Penicillium roqueforti]
MKLRAGIEALINDHQSQKLDVLLIQEPSTTAYRTHVNHSAWRLYQPTVESDSVRYRSLIYINRKLSTSSHRQTADSQILIFSVYIPPVPIHTPDGASAETTLSAIHDTIQNVTRDDSRALSLILAGDFNRHHPAWGSNHIQPRFIEDTGELVNFFHNYGLQSCLPRGTATFWSLSHPGRSSTIDQTVTNRPDLLFKCHIYHDNYSSDHRGTYSEWYLQARRNPTSKTRKAYNRADWEKIRKEIQELFEQPGELISAEALDTVVERLTSTTANAVDKHTPDLRPSLYSKRGRQASIGFDDYQTEVVPLDNAGLAQGSPLSPILFAFFNCDLVDQPVDFHEKTELIHITRKRKEQSQSQLIINGNTIKPSTTAKLLGIIFDHKLRWKEHVQQAVKRATKVNIALRGLRQLRPEQMRQLYEASSHQLSTTHRPSGIIRFETRPIYNTSAPYNERRSSASYLHFERLQQPHLT